MGEELDRTTERLSTTTEKLEVSEKRADELDRERKVLENKALDDDDKIELLQMQLKEAQLISEEMDKKFDAVSRTLVVVEGNLGRAEERAESGESKVAEYEEELNLLANNLKSVEVALDKANEKEYEYENTVRDLDERLEEALKRAEFAERTINKLEQQLDNCEEDFFNERTKLRNIMAELDQILAEITGQS